jgi:hypothetical protein
MSNPDWKKVEGIHRFTDSRSLPRRMQTWMCNVKMSGSKGFEYDQLTRDVGDELWRLQSRVKELEEVDQNTRIKELEELVAFLSRQIRLAIKELEGE